MPCTCPRYVTRVPRSTSAAVSLETGAKTVAIATLTHTSMGPSSAQCGTPPPLPDRHWPRRSELPALARRGGEPPKLHIRDDQDRAKAIRCRSPAARIPRRSPVRRQRDQSIRKGGHWPPGRPRNESKNRHAEHGGDEIARHFVHHCLNRSAASLRLTDHSDDAREHRVRANFVRSHH